ncbi:hypothetical protein CAEBREN_22048 [Caenorhabditis brenneri]|uniref:Uncharacterized protein n=1 Tax=Caenorhabditis brenneri TaxID=135651 RepID=G0NEW5_CAEBE|nr:hypothetical protein CAEBREN_22048 [Caenorhabditis brenneri]
MTFRSLVDGVIVIGNQRWEKIPSFEAIEDIQFAISTTTSFDPSTFQKVILSNRCRNLDFYCDNSNGGIYLNNFSTHQDLLDIKVDAIVFFVSKAFVYIGDKCLVISKSQINVQCQDEQFFIEMFESNSFLPPKKKRKGYVESRHVGICSGSYEMGVFTSSILSQPSLEVIQTAEDCVSSINLQTISSQAVLCSASPNFEPLSFSSEIYEEGESCEIEKQHENERIQEVYGNEKDESLQFVIPPTLLHLTKDVPENDEIVNNMKAELKNSHVVHDPDPILVVQRFFAIYYLKESLCFRSGKYDVISGNRRALAYKSLRVESTKMKFVFEITLEPQLRDEVLNLCRQGVQFPVQICRAMIRKYRQNPEEVLSIVKNMEMTNSDLLKLLSKVEPDLKFILQEKGISENVAEQFTQLFIANENFQKFVRGGDFRFVDKKRELADLTDRYNIFNSTHCEQNSKSSRIVMGESLTDIDIAITSYEKTATSIIERNDNVVVFLLGKLSQNANQFILRIPDHLSQKSLDGRLGIELIHEQATVIVPNDIIRRKFETVLQKKQQQQEEEAEPRTEE